MRLVLFALVAMAWIFGPIAAPTSSAPAANPAVPEVVSENVDFDALRAEARAALERLRELRERRVTTALAAAL